MRSLHGCNGRKVAHNVASRDFCSRRIGVLVRAQTSHQHLDIDDDCLWNEFCERVSGEWDGVTATFSPEGVAIPLPERYVPSAFREWGVELFDWQSQCSMVASTQAKSLSYRVRRMMPSVGCEADAIAFTEESTSCGIDTSRNSKIMEVKAVFRDGSYYAGPSSMSELAANTVTLEFCICKLDKLDTRVRVLVLLARREVTDWHTRSFEVHFERYEAPYQGGIDLTGCGGGMPGFAKSVSSSPSHVNPNGSALFNELWETESECSFGDPNGGYTMSESALASVALPLGLQLRWRLKSFEEDVEDDDNGSMMEVVWNMEGGQGRRRMTSVYKPLHPVQVRLNNERMASFCTEPS
ncbi:hypothetical protein CEUSTIGMA_g7776.t1 [Chlamydomonas eustigma]|uniref:DUF3598 domain-containing protein n=1 Tax=Chlamydomonas eustigma TaxID=1157962 RepID=A0A250XB82_9CHLO|nr:hypothetical protein CEUSTIGMA_g7776.t1 [Chlamydomonas eustigma]|eukprot:GAX80338.1 hypothetical protein CEUSTIGMA_g7776.t1 [Chlamydomonas eustigma]